MSIFDVSHGSNAHDVPSPNLISYDGYYYEGWGGVGTGYSSYNGTYGGWWDDDGGFDFSGSNAIKDGPSDPSEVNHPIQSFVERSDNTYAWVTFNQRTSDGLNANQLVTASLSYELTEIIKADTAIFRVDVSATTNGHANEVAPKDHENGRAVDIVSINNIHVSNSGEGLTLALNLKSQALADVNVRYVEGPGGNWARSSPGGQWQPSAPLPNSNTHVHIAVFK